VVATSEAELPALAELERRGNANGLEGIRRVGLSEMREIEPHVAGLAGLVVPQTGIVDFPGVCDAYVRLIGQAGGEVRTGARVEYVRRDGTELVLETVLGAVRARHLINCAGLQSDRVARLCGVDPGVQIIPFRGEYYELVPAAHRLVKHLIYPVPDARFPFLGVHFTRMVKGGVEAGPNAVLAFRREGYHKLDFSLRDTADLVTFPGFWRMAGKYWKMAAGEFHRSFSKAAFVEALQKLMPEIRADDLVPAGAGVRAQAVTPDGRAGGRFPHRRGRAHDPRAERAVSRRHREPQHRRRHRADGGEELWPGVTGRIMKDVSPNRFRKPPLPIRHRPRLERLALAAAASHSRPRGPGARVRPFRGRAGCRGAAGPAPAAGDHPVLRRACCRRTAVASAAQDQDSEPRPSSSAPRASTTTRWARRRTTSCRAWCTPTRTRCCSWSPTSAPPTAATACARAWWGRGRSCPITPCGSARWTTSAPTREIRDVLLSGGDPLIMADDRIEWLLAALRAIPHVEFLRIGTKVPAVLPQRITPALCRDAEEVPPAVHEPALRAPERADPGGRRWPAAGWPTPASRWAGRWCC
jgi:hypothetical protein